MAIEFNKFEIFLQVIFHNISNLFSLLQMKTRNYEKVEDLFHRCLVKVLNIDLWKCYLNYVRETKSGLPSFRFVLLTNVSKIFQDNFLLREKMTKAYEFAIDKIGFDVLSFPIWADYINFLKSA